MNKLLPVAIAALLLSLLLVLLVAGKSFRYPDGAIDFRGMSKQQALERLDSVRLPFGSPSDLRIYAMAASNGRWHHTVAEALADQALSDNDIWLVNPRNGFIYRFEQKLFFGTDGTVTQQTIETHLDGP